MQFNLIFSTDINYLPYLFVLCQSIVDQIEQRPSNTQDQLVFNVLIDDSIDLDSTKEKAKHFIERNSRYGIDFCFEWIRVDVNVFNSFTSMAKRIEKTLAATIA